MASTVALPEVPGEALETTGFFTAKDASLGDAISEMEQRHFAYSSEFGLDFCKRLVLNERMRSVIEDYFDGQECVLGHWLRYKAYPGHILCFRRGGPRGGRRRLLVHLLSRGARVGYWRYSHQHELPTSEGRRLLYELTEPDLVEAGCERVDEEFPHGGLVVLGGRVAYELCEGYAITFEFATLEVLNRWKKMELPRIPALVARVAEMETPKIRLNFEFRDLEASSSPGAQTTTTT